MTVIVEAREDFTLEAYRRVSVDGEDVVIGPAALRVIGEARAGFEDLLRSNRGGFIYGVTTRPGVEVGTTIPPEEQRDYALRFRGVGRGFGRDYLDERVVRGIVFARLADFVGGHAKVRPEVAQRVAALLNGPLPRVPLDGQGGAGEILPLMHVMAAVDGDLVEGVGMALLNGSPLFSRHYPSPPTMTERRTAALSALPGGIGYETLSMPSRRSSVDRGRNLPGI